MKIDRSVALRESLVAGYPVRSGVTIHCSCEVSRPVTAPLWRKTEALVQYSDTWPAFQLVARGVRNQSRRK